MPRACLRAVIALTGWSWLAGCSLVGAWRVVEVHPSDAAFPIASATFVDGQIYCASRAMGGQTRTDWGRYSWNGVQLTLKPEDGTPESYDGYLRLDQKLVLFHEPGGITAVLKRQTHEPPARP